MPAKAKVKELAVFGGEKTVTESLTPWPFVTDEEIEEVRLALIESRSDSRQSCAVGTGGRAEELEERFASELDLTMYGSRCWKDVSAVTEQIGRAFRKVTGRIDRVRPIEVE